MTDPTSAMDLNNQALVALVQMLAHVQVGAVAAHVFEWLKSRPQGARLWSVLNKQGKIVITASMAAATSLGVTATFSHDPSHPGVYGFFVTGVTAANIGVHLWSFLQSWVMQHAWYEKVVREVQSVAALSASAGGQQS